LLKGTGVAGCPEEFFEAVQEKAEEFERDYKPELERRGAARDAGKKMEREKELGKLMKDMAVSGEPSSKAKPGTGTKPKPTTEMDTFSDMEDSDSDEGDGDDEKGDAEGLSTRYQAALASAGGPSNSDDHSFARYLRTSQMNL